MRSITAAQVEGALDWKPLIECLRQAFRQGAQVPVRHHHNVENPDGPDGTLLLMPAWQPGRHVGVKLATVFPGNGSQGLPAVMGAYLLLDGKTGSPLALIDGPTLTLRRTAAASALAAGYLARADSERLLMVGTGALAPNLIAAHAAVRPIREVVIWGRSADKAAALAARLDRPDFRVSHSDDLEAAAGHADIITCATLSQNPLVQGEWLRPGQHLDLVGGFKPDMRETDDEAIRRAEVFVDTRDGACSEAGDIVQPLASGLLKAEEIAGDLFELTHGECVGRGGGDQITLFKSVGTALEDLAAAQLTVERA